MPFFSIPEFVKSFFRKRCVKHFLEHAFYLVILAILIPGFFFIEILLVVPKVVDEHSTWRTVHTFSAFFHLYNIVGNLFFGMFIDTSIKGRLLLNDQNEMGWSSCLVCETFTPPRSWHCDSCNICILKRDHHCSFFACCIGYFNYRYFLMFVFHVFIAMVHSFFINVQLIMKEVSWNSGLVIVKLFLPIAQNIALNNNSNENLYILLLQINVIVGLFTGFLFVYHIMNVLRGSTARESSINENMYNFGTKSNIIDVLGQRWYLTWLSPLIKSTLPGNGMYWNGKK